MTGDRPWLSGELHYPRIPRAYWESRLHMAYAMGLDAISTYTFWNVHEPRPGAYEFSGECDVAEFVATAARVGLRVILRPGPYVCAEWDLGGLPAWLLADGDVALRTADDAYMEPVRRWLRRLGQELSPLQRSRGGPIVAVQLENEYGAFGNDRAYLEALRSALDDAGFGESPYFTIDQPDDLERGSLPDVAIAVTFAPGEPERDLGALRTLRPGTPLACGEYWAGWFDHWGEEHATTDAAQQSTDLEWMVRNDCSVNVYMFHGGTSFGFYSGANAFDPVEYQPDTTSYDYDAALDEAGRPTAKYRAFRDVIARCRGIDARDIPPVPETVAIEAFDLPECAPLDDLLGDGIARERPEPMERFGQSFGYILYRTTLPHAGAGRLELTALRDFAIVRVDGVDAGYLDRRFDQRALDVRSPRDGAVLELLVENGGRINYGPKLGGERKGLEGPVTWAGHELLGWRAHCLPMDDLTPLRFGVFDRAAATFRRGVFEIEKPADTFIDVRSMGKGVLWINGRNAGRFWNVGPQGALYVPGVWLKPGSNEAIAFDIYPALSPPLLRGVPERMLTSP